MEQKFRKILILAFGIPFIFWIYLVFATQMAIKFDAYAFESLAKIICSGGWTEFLKQGPTLEPLYPFLISISMKTGALLGTSYYKIQTLLQIFILLLTQVLLYRILCDLKIKLAIRVVIIFYFGFSPSLLNASLSLFSEIITLPFILGAIFSIRVAWQSILKENLKKLLLAGLLFTLLVTIITFSKAMLEYIFIVFLLPFAWLALQSFIKKDWIKTKYTLIFLTIFFAISQGAFHTYRLLNQKYNGNYTFTDFRGPYMFYSYAVKRTSPLTKNLIGIAALSVPGEHVCTAVYGTACHEWWYDNYSAAYKKRTEWKKEGIPDNAINSKLIHEGIKIIAIHPFQYALFTSMEAIKLFFWESTQVGYVTYPSKLQSLYNSSIFKNILRLAVFLTTFIAFIDALIYTIKNRKLLLMLGDKASEYQLLFFIMFYILIFICLYSSVITITRYAFPVASLYLILIALRINRL